MRGYLYNLSLLCLCVTLSLNASAQAYQGMTAGVYPESISDGSSVEAEKKITKNYTVNATDRLAIENEFGKVHVNTWTKNEILVEVTVRVQGKSGNKAQELLNSISISEKKAGGSIFLKTVRSKNFTNNSLTIDYVVNMPAVNPLSITNRFGDVYVADFSGELNVTVNYGAFRGDNFSGDNKSIKVSFGSCSIESIETGNVNAQYSKLNIEKAGKIEVTGMFGKSFIKTVTDLNITQKYGDLDIRSVNQITGTVEFANLMIDKVGKMANMTLRYSGNANFGTIGPGVDLIRINSSFSTLYFRFDEKSSLNLDVESRFGEMKYLGSKYPELRTFKDSKGNNATYQGKIGKSPEGTLIINASYGNIHLQ